MSTARVVSIWPTFVGDFGKPRKLVVLFPEDRQPSWGDGRTRFFPTREVAQSYADSVNGFRRDWP